MEKQIAETRAIWQRTAFAWGTHDCIIATCDHVRRVTGIDPAAPWRGTYSDEAGARAIYEAHGGVMGLFEHGMRLAGFTRGENAPGAAVVASIGGHTVAGVNMGAMTAFVSPLRAMSELRIPVLSAWPL